MSQAAPEYSSTQWMGADLRTLPRQVQLRCLEHSDTPTEGAGCWQTAEQEPVVVKGHLVEGEKQNFSLQSGKITCFCWGFHISTTRKSISSWKETIASPTSRSDWSTSLTSALPFTPSAAKAMMLDKRTCWELFSEWTHTLFFDVTGSETCCNKLPNCTLNGALMYQSLTVTTFSSHSHS